MGLGGVGRGLEGLSGVVWGCVGFRGVAWGCVGLCGIVSRFLFFGFLVLFGVALVFLALIAAAFANLPPSICTLPIHPMSFSSRPSNVSGETKIPLSNINWARYRFRFTPDTGWCFIC